MSISEQTSNNLKVARNLIHKNGAIIKDFQSHSHSIIALNEQWRNLQNSFEIVHYSLENRVKELESKEIELILNKNQIENSQKKVELRQEKLEFEENSLSEKIEIVEMREKQVEDRMRAMKERQRMVEEREKESKAVAEAMDCSEKVLNKLTESLKLKVGELSKHFLVLEKEKKVLELRKEELCNVVDLKENEMKEAMEIKETEISMLREALLFLSKKMMLKEKEVNEHCENMEVKKKQMNESYQREKRSGGNLMLFRCRDQETRKKQSVDSSLSKIRHDIHSLCKHMDADGVRSYLIKHVKEQNILQEKVLDAIRFAPNPGKLVLVVCQSVHQKHPDKGQLVTNQNSCIFLLEQFMKLSAPITRDVEHDAIYFAGYLKDWLKGNSTPADIFEFLQFLAAFKLAGHYNADELLSLLGRLYGGAEVYLHEKQASLCRALGILKKIPGVIKSLIVSKKLLLAVKYICVFKLECKFLPVVPLLVSYLDLSKKRVNEKCKDGTPKSKIQADLQELDILREVTTCIATFKLQSKFPPDFLLSRIKELEKQISERRKSADAFTSLKKRSASVASPKQLQKRPRLGNV